MHRLFAPRRGAMTLIATVAAAVVVAGAAYAATSDPSGTAKRAAAGRIYACVTLQFRTLNLTSAGARCPNGESKISWTAAGTRGPRGADGRTGPSGAAGPQGPAGAAGSTGPQGPAGAAGSTGPQGPSGATGTGVLSGSGPPSTTLGANGDFYIDTSANTLYGPKSDAGWGSPVSLVGPQGPQGATGSTGSTGATGPPGPTASAFGEGGTALPSSGSATVVSFTIDPSFAGNLLVQGSGFVDYTSQSGAGCQAFVDGNPMGSGSNADVTDTATTESISVTGAAAVAAGTHTVTIQCSTELGGTTPTVVLNAFALVAAS
jgi:Collagen triple helix repeat (20 copies)